MLHTDASGGGISSCLYQIQEGRKRVIAYASKSLSRSKKNYPAYKLEVLALNWTIINKFMTTCMVLNFKCVQTTGKLNATSQRGTAALLNSTFNITYKPERNH